MQVRTHSGTSRGASAAVSVVRVVLAVAAALTAAATVTIASSSRLPGPNVTTIARVPLPITPTVDRRLKGDRLDRARPQPSSSSPGEVTSPEDIVPKTVPPTPPDPVGSPREDLLERGCLPISRNTPEPPNGAQLALPKQCVASTRANNRRSVASATR